MERLDVFQAYIENRFKVHAAAVLPDLAIRWPNTLFVPPNDRVFVEWRLLPEQGFQASMGSNPTFRHVGGVQIDVLSPKDSGTREATVVARKLTALFDAKQMRIEHGHTVTFRHASTKDGTEQNNNQRLIVRIPYWRDAKRFDEAA